ncbi:hypothetical protein GH714_017090 [Hevea brasiliensis]|uniref:Uncharacterized protein n=1 Tax=Hevea brasiliensis TaxID=3981 RepID=A0A6A6LSA4_HEVBR|nr:hypothetical protein GH714_017090 [Hevea brasiliensis]
MARTQGLNGLEDCPKPLSWDVKRPNYPKYIFKIYLLFTFPLPALLLEREAPRFVRKRTEEMLPHQWAQPCGGHCTHKYAALTQIPWRVFCKKGCDADGETWEECLEECNEICYKDPVLKDQQWSAYIDRSPGAASYSEECFHACVSGCGYKLEIEQDKVDQARPNRPCKPPPPLKPALFRSLLH